MILLKLFYLSIKMDILELCADIGVFSFEKTKHITTGSEGGMVVTNSETLAEKN